MELTPKEKADNLCMRFRTDTHSNEFNYGINKELAKQCALIAVDEIISACEYNNVESHNTVWWEKVKVEVKNLAG